MLPSDIWLHCSVAVEEIPEGGCRSNSSTLLPIYAALFAALQQMPLQDDVLWVPIYVRIYRVFFIVNVHRYCITWHAACKLSLRIISHVPSASGKIMQLQYS